MRVGIDIDGVLTNIMQYICDYSSKYFFLKYGNLNGRMFNIAKEWLKNNDIIYDKLYLRS